MSPHSSSITEIIDEILTSNSQAVLCSNKNELIAGIKEKYPQRVIDNNQSSSHLINFCRGTAKTDQYPLLLIDTHALTDNYQILNQINLQQEKIIILALSGGLSAGEQGVFKQSPADIAIMRTLYNFKIFAPADHQETSKIISESLKTEGPTYIRLGTASLANIFSNLKKTIQAPELVSESESEITVFSSGTILRSILFANEMFRQETKLSLNIIHCPCLQDLPAKDILKYINKNHTIICIEEHLKHGGLFSIISDIVNANYLAVKVHHIGIDPKKALAGPLDDLYLHQELDPDGLFLQIQNIVKQNN